MVSPQDSFPKRGTRDNPPNQYQRLHYESIEADGEGPETRFYEDRSQSILAENDSPDIPFRYSINPYRGCEHGCVYCYARPTHEYLDFSAGTDFESRIMVKTRAPELLRERFERPGWEPQVVTLSGNTDPYQPVERETRLTRRCLEVFQEYRNPVSIITKNHLITRDADLLEAMAKHDLVAVRLSVTTLKRELARVMEPRTSRPGRRLDAIRTLAEHDVPVGVNAAPMIPGLTDSELPEILRAAAEHGAETAGYTLVRLPGPVKELFRSWIREQFPDRAAKVLRQIRGTRGGAMYDSRFGHRMRGEGEVADMLKQLFETTCRKLDLNTSGNALKTDGFRRGPSEQREMF